MTRQSHTDVAIDLARSRVVVLLNRASGSVNARTEVTARDLLDGAGAAHACIISADPSNLDEVLTRAICDSDVLVLLAGDGTISAAANRCAGAGPALVPLPGGTMNVFSRALYGRHPWPEILREVLAKPRARGVSGGRAADHLFLVSAILGAPSPWTEAREALRRGHLVAAAGLVAEALRRPWGEELAYDFCDGIQGVARAVAVRCPLVSRSLEPDAAALEAAAIDPHSAAQAIELGVNALFGRWREDPRIVMATTARIALRRAAGVPAILDGESVLLPASVEIRFVPQAATVLSRAPP